MCNVKVVLFKVKNKTRMPTIIITASSILYWRYLRGRRETKILNCPYFQGDSQIKWDPAIIEVLLCCQCSKDNVHKYLLLNPWGIPASYIFLHCGVCFCLNKSTSYLWLHLHVLLQWSKNLKFTSNIIISWNPTNTTVLISHFRKEVDEAYWARVVFPDVAAKNQNQFVRSLNLQSLWCCFLTFTGLCLESAESAS